MMEPTVFIQYECGEEMVEAGCEPIVDIHGEVFCAVDECPLCGGEHYITV